MVDELEALRARVDDLETKLAKLDFLFCPQCHAFMLNFIQHHNAGAVGAVVFLDHHEKWCAKRRP